MRVGTGSTMVFLPTKAAPKKPFGLCRLSRKTSDFRVSLPNHKAALSSLQAHCILSILATARTAVLVIDTEPGTRSRN